MATTIKEFLVRLGVDADSKNLKRFASGMQRARRAAGQLVKGVAAVAGGAAAATGAIVGLVKQAANVGDNAAKTAQQIGTTAEAFQEMAFAADLSAVSQRELETGMRRLARNANDMKSGTGEAADAFRTLGVSVTDASGQLKGTTQLTQEVADALAGLEDEQQKVALASEVFGRSGSKLLPMLNKGSAGIKEMRQEARDLGGVMSDAAAKQSEEFNDSLTRLRFVFRGLRNTLGTELMPVLMDLIRQFRAYVEDNRDFIRSRIKKFAKDLVDLFRGLADAFRTADDVAQRFGGWIPMLTTIAEVSASIAATWAGSKIVGTINGAITAGSALASTLGSVAAKSAAANTSGTLMGASLKTAFGGIGSAASSLIGTTGPLAVIGVTLHDIWALGAGEDTITGSLLDWLETFELLEDEVKAFRSAWDTMTTELAYGTEALFGTMDMRPDDALVRGDHKEASARRARQRSRDVDQTIVQQAQKTGQSLEEVTAYLPEDQQTRILSRIRAGQSRSARAGAGGGGRPTVNVQNKNDVTVNAPNADAQEVGRVVDEKLRESEERMMRNARDPRVKGGAQ